MSNTKQVIVIRKDLKMRRGKEIAQGSHASMAFLTKRLKKSDNNILTLIEKEWLDNSFTKVCVKVNSYLELIDLHAEATAAGLESHLIVDNGLTEFNHVHTATALAIGPDESEKIDKITGHLELY